MAVYGRFIDPSNYLGIRLLGNGAVATSLRENGGGTDASDPTRTLPSGQWYTVRVEARVDAEDVSGRSIVQIYVDDVLFGGFSQVNPTSGRVAIGTYNATARFDDVRVTLL